MSVLRCGASGRSKAIRPLNTYSRCILILPLHLCPAGQARVFIAAIGCAARGPRGHAGALSVGMLVHSPRIRQILATE